MIDKESIIETIARERRVETMVARIARQPLTSDLEDLCQMVYLVICEYEEGKLQDLWEHNQINFFIARIILNQYRSRNSPFYKIYRKENKTIVHMGVGAEINDQTLDLLKRDERK